MKIPTILSCKIIYNIRQAWTEIKQDMLTKAYSVIPGTVLKLLGKQQSIVVVSGLPRSGTSLMMQMLTSGGLEPVTDNIRKADENNPKGYFEFERVKALPDGDTQWLTQSQGKVVKIVSVLLTSLPDSYSYKIIFMRRDLEEIVKSQMRMLRRLERDSVTSDTEQDLREGYRSHLSRTIRWLDSSPNFETLFVNHRNALYHPDTWAREINLFLGNILDETAMVSTVDRGLYRERKVN